jgi:dihydroorotate dehydrogenase electron transfer subunit
LRPTRLHKAEVMLHDRAGGGYFRLMLRAPELAAAALPGQFVMLRVSENHDPLLARPFGIASVVSRRSIELYYRIAGRGTALLASVRRGQRLDLLGPLGNGFPEPQRNATLLLIAGGSGFPPLLFFTARYGKRARLFVGSRDKACLPPPSVMKDFRRRVQSIHYATEDGSRGACGFVTEALSAFLRTADRCQHPVIYACGPHAMLAAVSRLAADEGIPCLVSMEERMACGLGVCMGCSVPLVGGGYKRVCKDGPVFLSTEIAWHGTTELRMRTGSGGNRSSGKT